MGLKFFSNLKHALITVINFIICREGISPNGDSSTIIFYIATLVSVAQFDALAPYHPTSEGILAKLIKRPYHERTMENKNVAAIYAGNKQSNDCSNAD